MKEWGDERIVVLFVDVLASVQGVHCKLQISCREVVCIDDWGRNKGRFSVTKIIIVELNCYYIVHCSWMAEVL